MFRKRRMEPGFHELIKIDETAIESVDDLRECLDSWSTKTTKNKKKKRKDAVENKEYKSETFSAEIEVLGNRSFFCYCMICYF